MLVNVSSLVILGVLVAFRVELVGGAPIWVFVEFLADSAVDCDVGVSVWIVLLDMGWVAVVVVCVSVCTLWCLFVCLCVCPVCACMYV